MLPVRLFGEELKRLGYNFFSGVPCSYLKNLICYAIEQTDYIIASNEGDAVAMAAGATVGGKKSVVLMQNSGLGNAISPLTSLNYIFRIPVLGFVSLRGEEGASDEPQHELMGKITTSILDIIRIEWAFLSPDPEEAKEQLKHADEVTGKNQSFFFVVRKNTFDEEELESVGIESENSSRESFKEYPSRYEVLEKIHQSRDSNTVIIATTGYTGRELYEIEDSPGNFYMVGSMGCAGPFSLGLSLKAKGKNIIAIDGDGSLLMRAGTLATEAHYRPPNMLHILLDNNSYESTGCQKTVSSIVDFVALARAFGYKNACAVKNIDELEEAIKKWKGKRELTLLYMRIRTGTKEKLARPRVRPYEVKERLMRELGLD